jgi:hypothetical protein
MVQMKAIYCSQITSSMFNNDKYIKEETTWPVTL